MGSWCDEPNLKLVEGTGIITWTLTTNTTTRQIFLKMLGQPWLMWSALELGIEQFKCLYMYANHLWNCLHYCLKQNKPDYTAFHIHRIMLFWDCNVTVARDTMLFGWESTLVIQVCDRSRQSLRGKLKLRGGKSPSSPPSVWNTASTGIIQIEVKPCISTCLDFAAKLFVHAALTRYRMPTCKLWEYNSTCVGLRLMKVQKVYLSQFYPKA